MTAALRRAVATEVAEKLGDDPQVWARFEQIRGARPRLSLGDVLSQAVSGTP